MNYAIWGIPILFIIYLLIKYFDWEKILRKIIGEQRSDKIIDKADKIFGFKKRQVDGTYKEQTPLWVKFLIILVYVIFIILGGGGLIYLMYLLIKGG